jgi:hypothetical protein
MVRLTGFPSYPYGTLWAFLVSLPAYIVDLMVGAAPAIRPDKAGIDLTGDYRFYRPYRSLSGLMTQILIFPMHFKDAGQFQAEGSQGRSADSKVLSK